MLLQQLAASWGVFYFSSCVTSALSLPSSSFFNTFWFCVSSFVSCFHLSLGFSRGMIVGGPWFDDAAGR